MVFSSPLFLFWFLPAALAGYYVLFAGPRWLRHLFLTAFSYVFYGWANPLFVPLLFATTALDFCIALYVARDPRPVGGPRTRRQRVALTLSICANLGVLGFFKYSGFAIESYNDVMEALGLGHLAWQDFLRVTLPLGISFYTFHCMSYTIDTYRGNVDPTRSPIDFFAYVSLFSQLVAGPIVRYSEVAKQLVVRTHSFEKFSRGVAMFSFGMAKKVLLANPCGQIADLCFGAGSLHALDAWIGLLSYAFQLYFDFSGYSDMAVGLGLMMGFTFPKNFNAPYRSRSLTEYWSRWHMSLSTWLRDYLYVPLGGNRKGVARTYVNLMIVMLLGGLWHGAALHFVVWGGLNGVILAAERARGGRPFAAALPVPFQIATAFVIWLFTLVFIRAPDLHAAARYLGHMAGLEGVQPGAVLVGAIAREPYSLGAIAASALIVWGAPQAWDFTKRIDVPRAALSLGLLWAACAMLFAQTYNPFIYFFF